jgi:capsular polysaccharide export protein
MMIHALDFSHWKRSSLQRFLAPANVKFVNHIAQVPQCATLAVWGMRNVPAASARHLSVLRIEDGFLRSVGLGADLIRPVSWVVDRLGMHFDPSHPSELEMLLAQTVFSTPLLQRAAALRKRIVANRLTKYNIGGTGWQRPAHATRVILVPGQVQSDASLLFGAPGIKTNQELLRAVRHAHPSAHVIYKPHPDVLAGLRGSAREEVAASDLYDQLVTEACMAELLDQVDEVHCLTSLTGFEALLRDKPVSCYGLPFYAGWGLTTDMLAIPRRQRRLALDELVAAALILYPRYLDWERNRLVSPEEALEQLMTRRDHSAPGTPVWRKVFRLALRWHKGMT